jgi:hypothetical protein
MFAKKLNRRLTIFYETDSPNANYLRRSRGVVNDRVFLVTCFSAPGTAPDTVKTLRGAMAKALNDPEFPQEFKKLMEQQSKPPKRGRIRGCHPRTSTRPSDGRAVQESRRRWTAAYTLTFFGDRL